MTLAERIYALPDSQVGPILDRALKGIARSDSNAAGLLLTKEAVIEGSLVTVIPDIALVQRLDPPRAAQVGRELLIVLAEDPVLAERVENAIDTYVDVLFEPVTTAIILAGLVIALQSRFKLKYRSKPDGTGLNVDVEKDSTSDKLIERILSPVSPGNG